MITDSMGKFTGIGIQTFGSLRAEDEPWLEQCVVPPANLDRLMNNRSVIIFGGIGAGKTTLYKLLKRRNLVHDGTPRRLLVDWRLTTPAPEARSDISSVAQQVYQLYDLCAMQLAAFLTAFPQRFQEAPDYAQERIGWFIHRYLHNAPTLRLGQLLKQNTAGAQVLQTLLATPPTEILYPDAAPELVLDELSIALQPLGLEGIWIMVDDIERLAQIDHHALRENLLALLATLPLFERSEFAFKLFIPNRLEADLSSASGVFRRRIDAVRLHWTPLELTRIVEERLRLATGMPDFSLETLCASPKLQPWLEAAGGDSPRHWLDQVHPLIEHYLHRRLTTPIDEKTWKKLRTAVPPKFYLFEEERRIIVGGREITLDQIPAKAFDMLTYLYDHGNKIVPKEELYYRAYLGHAAVPLEIDERFEHRDDWEGVIDTTLWRLRCVLEPDPKQPTLLETKRGQGLILHVRW